MAGHLTFTRLAVSDLRKTESLFASNDPYCKVILNGDSFKTPAIKNGGSSAAWPGPLQLAVPSIADLKEVRIEVWQDSSSKKKTDDVLIGFGTIAVSDLAAAAAAGLAKTAALSYEKKGKLDSAGKFSAQIVFTATPTAPTPAPTAPAAVAVQAAPAAPAAPVPAAAAVAVVPPVVVAAEAPSAAAPAQAVAPVTAAPPVQAPVVAAVVAPVATQPTVVPQSAVAAAVASDRQLKLTHLAASELRHTEAGFRLTANNDPYIKFITKGATVRTSTKKNGGSSGQWSEEYTLNISNSTSLNEPVLCEVWNCNVNDGKDVPDVLIGSGELLIGNLVVNVTAGCAKSLLLVAPDGKTASGKISCTAALIPTATAATPTVAAAAAHDTPAAATATTAGTIVAAAAAVRAGSTSSNSSNSSSADMVQLRIHSVSGSGLKDHSSRKGISTKYLYIKHSCAGKLEHSNSVDGSSKHGCTWPGETVFTPVPANCNPLRSEIWCDNSNLATVTQDTLLGWCEFNISKLTIGAGTEGSSFEVPISYEESGKSKSKGTLKLTAVKEPVSAPTAKTEPKPEPAAVRVHRASVDTSNLNGRLLLSGLSAIDMPETESILLGGKQDPFVRAYLQCHAADSSVQHKQETSVQLKGGKSCAWSGESLVLSDATTATLQSGLVLEVWNKNDFKKNDLIGTVTLQYDALQALIAKSVASTGNGSSGRAQQTHVKLCRPGARAEGVLTLSVAFEATDATKTIPAATTAAATADHTAATAAGGDTVQSDAVTAATAVVVENSYVPDAIGTFMLSGIQARGLAETENLAARLVGNKQDPLVIAKLGAVEGRTTVRNNAGTAVDWGEEIIALQHTGTVLDSSAELVIEVVNSNVLKDASIGKTRVLLTQLQSAIRLGHTDQGMTLSLPLTRDGNGKKKAVEKGSVTLQLKFVPRDSAVAVTHELSATAAAAAVVGAVNAGSSSAVTAVAEAGVRAAGYIRLYELSATDLPNTEGLLQLGKQDPYIVARCVRTLRYCYIEQRACSTTL
jgi:C2 domain